MNAALVTQNQTLRFLISQLEQNNAVSEALRSYFAPYCTTSLVDWLKARIAASDSVVLAKISALIAPPAIVLVPVSTAFAPAGYLVRSYCSIDAFIGVYADGNGGTYEVRREDLLAGHPCAGLPLL